MDQPIDINRIDRRSFVEKPMLSSGMGAVSTGAVGSVVLLKSRTESVLFCALPSCTVERE